MEYLSRLKKGESLSVAFYILPAFLPLLLFWLWPMINSVYISFTDWDYMSPDYNFVGLGNYFDLFSDPGFYKVLGNTIYFSIGTVIPTIIGGLGLALLLRNNLTGAGVYRTILFSPWITPTVAISIVWSWIFEPRYGFANWILNLVGFPKLEWTHSSKYAMVAIIIVTVWKGLGWAMIFYLSALKKVPNELYEAAEIDGANKWNKFRNITLPVISPTTFFLTIITTITALQAYDQIQILTQGGPAGSTRTILYMYYQSAFENFNVGQATAVATVLVIITSILSGIQFIASKKWVHY